MNNVFAYAQKTITLKPPSLAALTISRAEPPSLNVDEMIKLGLIDSAQARALLNLSS